MTFSGCYSLASWDDKEKITEGSIDEESKLANLPITELSNWNAQEKPMKIIKTAKRAQDIGKFLNKYKKVNSFP